MSNLFKSKSIAVTSGKGGVGKTTTAANIAIHYAKKGKRVALIDIDPLSDLSSLLDLKNTNEANPDTQSTADFEKARIKAFKNLHILFPANKLTDEAQKTLYSDIFSKHAEQMNQDYDLLVFDLPAGLRFEDNLQYLPSIGKVIVVTNPEPTAHVSTGAYIRKAFDEFKAFQLYVWHNKYKADIASPYDEKDLVGNYNKRVAEDAWISHEEKRWIHDLAFIPDDPSLDLLQSFPSPVLTAYRELLEVMKLLYEQILDMNREKSGLSPKIFSMSKGFLAAKLALPKHETLLDGLVEHLKSFLLMKLPAGAAPAQIDKILRDTEFFTPAQKESVKKYLLWLDEDPLCKTLRLSLRLLERKYDELIESRSIFSGYKQVEVDKNIDRELSRVLLYLSEISNRDVKNLSALLVVHFSMYKLMQSPSIVSLIKQYIPYRKNSEGEDVRNRQQQIRYLVEPDSGFRQDYLKLLKKMYPVVMKQVTTLVRTFGVEDLLYTKNRELYKEAYVKLLSNFLHTSLFSGLSVIIGFDYRQSSLAFEEALKRLDSES